MDELRTIGAIARDAAAEIDRLTEQVARLKDELYASYVRTVTAEDDDGKSYCSACGAWFDDIAEHTSDCWLIELIGPRALPKGTT
jgi:hypothetical protein